MMTGQGKEEVRPYSGGKAIGAGAKREWRGKKSHDK